MRDRREVADVPDHGGSLARAEALFPDAPRPWLDLSTGINPHAYPFSPPPATAFSRLPEPSAVDALAATAARAFGASGVAGVVCAPGTQILLPLVMRTVAPGRAAVLSPTYAEHARAARIAGHAVVETSDFDELASADLAIVVNPNNPTGRVVPRAALLKLATAQAAKGGLLVVDEAFMEVGPREESLAADAGMPGLLVLRSFGKFYGLAGIRLGFAITDPARAANLNGELGPWAISGPTLHIAGEALADDKWRENMRERLSAAAADLDRALNSPQIHIAGGTSLFRFIRTTDAQRLFRHLGSHGILTRPFSFAPDVLRIGLPADEAGYERLARAVGSCAG